jgi:hypothetical protein
MGVGSRRHLTNRWEHFSGKGVFMEIDHFYFCVDKPDEIAEMLINFGLVEGKPNTHLGQGTANRRFFFQNTMLELLYLTNEDEIQSERTKILGLYEQFSKKNRSKIGIIWRPSENEKKDCSFKSNVYRPKYLPEHLFMNIATGLTEHEPNCIYLDFAVQVTNRERIIHTLDGNEVNIVTKIILKTKVKSHSDALLYMVNNSNLNLEASNEDILEIELDGFINGKVKDFKPALPLRIKW